jgi:hypothetical protein
MTATETMAAPTTTDTWTAEMAQLRNRYKAVREPILAALNLLLQDPNITDDDAKARAAMRGIRITAASINGARNLLLKAGDAQATTATPTTPATPTSTAAAPQRAARRARPAEGSVDAEALIRQVVGKLLSQGNAETERLRGAVQKAIAVLQAAVG